MSEQQQQSEIADVEPHAYAVETLWNRGGFSERWGMAMEMADVRQPLDHDDAEHLMAEMIEDGHAPDAVRLVAISAVTSSPAPSTFETHAEALDAATERRLDGYDDLRNPPERQCACAAHVDGDADCTCSCPLYTHVGDTSEDGGQSR